MGRKLVLGLAGATVLAASVTGAKMMAAEGFDGTKWKSLQGSRARDNPRAGMVSQVEERLKAGMTRAEVVQLLGTPEIDDDRRFTYSLGTSAFGVDYEYFIVEFDEEGRVLRHAVRRG